MNTGTKIRTILVIATSINTALMATDLTGFGNHAVDIAYNIFSVVCNFVIVACSTYFNNDYSVEAAEGTGYTRQLKAENSADYVGENFFDKIEEVIEEVVETEGEENEEQ